MLEIKNLYVASGKKKIINGVNLRIKKGETHFLMGPNGAGKSTLGMATMGYPRFRITKGTVFLGGKNITSLAPEERAKAGLFLAFQHPLEFEGIRLFSFLRSIAVQNSLGSVPLPLVFHAELEKKALTFGMTKDFGERYLNVGVSGGEKKKTEVLQLLYARPKIAILDEIDSGLDVDSLRQAAKAIADFKKLSDLALLVVTHHVRIAKYLPPQRVHIMTEGKITESGGKNLISKIDKHGYKTFK